MVLAMARALLIVNPHATAVTAESAEAVQRELSSAAELHVVWTDRAGHATELARQSDADAVLVFSGDGGFNEVLNGIGADRPVGFVPGGGSSVLPRALGFPRDPEAAARVLAESLRGEHVRRIGVGRVNGRRFGFAAGLGFPAEIVRRVDQLGRRNGRRPPDRTFAVTVARSLFARRGRLDPAMEVDGEQAAFVMVANGDPYTYLTRLPLRFAPEARFEGGLDLVAPLRVRARSIPRLAAAAAFGRKAGGVLYRHDVDRVEVRAPSPLPLQVDGEDLGDVEQAVFESERQAVSVLVPR
jgi:diacylglycerol kinase family enzyme